MSEKTCDIESLRDELWVMAFDYEKYIKSGLPRDRRKADLVFRRIRNCIGDPATFDCDFQTVDALDEIANFCEVWTPEIERGADIVASRMIAEEARLHAGALNGICLQETEGAESKPDGPISGCGFRWNGQEYFRMTSKAWKLVEFLYQTERLRGDRDSIPEIWDDQALDASFEDGAFRGAKSAANSFFKNNDIPMMISQDSKIGEFWIENKTRTQ